MVKVHRPLPFILVVVLGIFALFAGGRLLYSLLYISLLLIGLPMVWLWVSLTRLQGSFVVTPQSGEVGDFLEVRYHIDNTRGGTFPFLELVSTLGPTFTAPGQNRLVALARGDSPDFQYTIRCNRRGRFQTRAFTIRTGDPFGIFSLTRSLDGGVEVRVYPRLRFLPAGELPARQHFGNLPARDHFLENYSLLKDLREWQPGDGGKTIHWKQSLRQNTVIVKNFDNVGDTMVSLFPSMNKGDYSRDDSGNFVDTVVETSCSIVLGFLNAGVPVRVYAPGLGGYPVMVRHSGDFPALLDGFLDLFPVSDSQLRQEVSREMYGFLPRSSVYLVSPVLTEQDAFFLLDLKHRGFNVVYILVAYANLPDSIVQLIERLEFQGIRITRVPPQKGDV